MYKVLKRDKQIVAFDIHKITEAIKKAFDAEKVNYEDSLVCTGCRAVGLCVAVPCV